LKQSNIVLFTLIIAALFVAGCGTNELASAEPEEDENMNPVVLMKTTHGDVKIELYEDVMPITAGNFKKLVEEGFYDGLTFHRVISNFMIQGGCPRGDGTGDPGYKIKDEFVDDPRLVNARGTLSMANSGPNSGGSQFFINLVDNNYLDWNKPPTASKHPVFAKVIEGMSVIDRIGAVKTSGGDAPAEPVVMVTVTII